MIHLNGKKHDLGGGLFVNRILPDRTKRMVGPFTFLDHMGAIVTSPGQNTDVRPHPHIGLSTLTYLFEGRMVHRDSLGTIAEITPGEVNWMTAGKGISHSERAPVEEQGRSRALHGLQFWVALPEETEDCEPSFQHYDQPSIPSLTTTDYSLSLIAGKAFELESPVQTTSPLVFAELKAKNDFNFNLKIPGFELAAYIIHGSATNEANSIKSTEMIISETDQTLNLKIQKGTHLIIIGGQPFKNPRFMWWNLVSSSKEKIERAKKDWAEGRFPMVPGETEFIPLPLS